MREKNIHGIELVLRKKMFYQICTKYFALIVLVQIFVVICLLILNAYILRINLPEAKYFPVQENSKLIMDPPLYKRIEADELFINKMLNEAEKVFYFDYVNYKSDLQKKRQYFTARGYRNFLDALERSNNIELLLKKKMVASLKRTSNDYKLIENKVRQGRMYWVVEVPIIVTYQNGNDETFRQESTLRLSFVRESFLKSKYGALIFQYIY